MKKLFLALLLCAAPAAAQSRQQPGPREPGRPTVRPADGPEALPGELWGRELKDLGGGAFRLSDFRGRVFVINVWASWCGPCDRLIPELKKIQEDHAARGVGVVVLTTESPEEDGGRVRESARRLRMKFNRVGWADLETANALLKDRPSVPLTLVVARDGRVLERLVGYSERIPPAVRDAVEEALALAPPPESAGPVPPPARPAPLKL